MSGMRGFRVMSMPAICYNGVLREYWGHRVLWSRGFVSACFAWQGHNACVIVELQKFND
jgi:hypothetical protein